MTTATTARAASPASIISLKGRGKAMREGAFMRIAPLSFVEALSRTESIENLKVALGVAPTESELSVAGVEWQAGRVANRLSHAEFPKDCTESADKLDHARDLILHYATPPADGKAGRKLKSGQKGRRSPAQQKAIRAAQEAWSQVLSELGHGTARTQKEKNERQAAKRSTNTNPVRGDGKGSAKGATPTHGELVKAPAADTPTTAMQFLVSQSVTLLSFANKHAKLLPADFGQAVRAFNKAIGAAARAAEEREAAKNA